MCIDKNKLNKFDKEIEIEKKINSEKEILLHLMHLPPDSIYKIHCWRKESHVCLVERGGSCWYGGGI
jgi:hypothetical protein